MNIKQFETFTLNLFRDERLDEAIDNGEIGLTYNSGRAAQILGYATSLTPKIIQRAAEQNIDLILTHHDAWKSIPDMNESCKKLLQEKQISHFFSHLPLDDADFGTNQSLAIELGLKVLKKFCLEDSYSCGVICELEDSLKLSEFTQIVETALNEKVKVWKNSDKQVKRIGIVSGGGLSPNDLKEALDNSCDTYLTGEKILYTIQYAELVKLNLIVASHTFTEIFGVRELAKIIQKEFKDLEVVQIHEDHYE